MVPRDANIASHYFLAALQRMGDGFVKVLLAIFGLVIVLFNLAIAHLEQACAPIAPTLVPTAIICEPNALLTLVVR